MELTRFGACPLCGSARIRRYRTGSFDPAQLESDHFRITDSRYGSLWNLDRCRDCTYVFANPAPDAATVEGFYRGLVDDEYDEESRGREKNFATVLRRLKRLCPPGNRLLDVGAASGIFMNLAADAGYAVDGIEPSRYLCREAEARTGRKVFCGTLSTFPPVEPYAVITLLDLIEHVTEPNGLLAAVSARLQTGGLVVLVTPDIGSLAARLSGRRWWHFRVAHINFFNRRSATRLLERHGLEIVRRRRYAWHFTPYYLLTRLFPGLRHRAALQKWFKRVHLKLQLFDSWEIYARKV